MPQLPNCGVTYNVLLTGFGPSPQFKANPSWLAVQPLQNTFIPLDPPVHQNDSDSQSAPPEHQPTLEGQRILNEEPKRPAPREIRISALEIPVEYEAIMSIVPGLHARPPVLPESATEDITFPTPPERGYDFIFHIGAAGRGPLRMEKMAHKTGYHMKDALTKYAPQCQTGKKTDDTNGTIVVAGPGAPPENLEALPNHQLVPAVIHVPGSPVDNFLTRTNRGFGPGYERLEEELSSDIDVVRLVQDMKQAGIEGVYSSMDAGHYICDFIYYCSLAEAKRNGKPYDKDTRRVLLLHCPPVNQPVSTEAVTDAIKQVILWVCEDTINNA